MKLTFGMHKGEEIARVVIGSPDYVWWMINLPEMDDKMKAACQEVQRLIEIFDKQPFVCDCVGGDLSNKCAKPVTRASLYRRTRNPWFWCDSCDPLSHVPQRWKLHVFSKYLDGLASVSQHELSKSAQRDHMKSVVQKLAEAKGLRNYATELDFRTEPE